MKRFFCLCRSVRYRSLLPVIFIILCLLPIALSFSFAAESRGPAGRGETRPYIYSIASIVITGKPFFSSQRIAMAMGVKPGSKISTVELKGLRERVRNFYRDGGYLEAEIGQPTLVLREGAEAVLSMNVNAGLRVRIEFPGQSYFSSRRLRELTGLQHRSIFIEGVLREAGKRIERHYRDEGYYFARVRHEVEISEEEGLKTIRYQVDKGNRVWVEKIEVGGNKAFGDAHIKRAMKLKERGLLHRGTLKEGVLKEDPRRIQDFYLDRGYVDIEVFPPYLDFQREGESALVGIELEEGGRYGYGGAVLKGFSVLAPEEVEQMLGLGRGEPFGALKVEKGIERIKKYYLDHGFVDMELSSDIKKRDFEKAVALELSVAEGVKYHVGNLAAAGNKKTKSELIQRKLTLKEGDVYSQEKVQGTVENLRQTGLFTTIRVQPAKREKTEGIMDITLELKEAKAGLLEVGAGYGSEEGINAQLRAAYRNIGGMDRRIEATIKGSGLGLESELKYTDPYLFGSEFAGSALTRYSEKDEEFFKVAKLENVYSLGRSFMRIYGLELDYSVEFTDFFDVKSPTMLGEKGGETHRIAFIRPALFRDTRDDVINPRKGMYTRLSLELAQKALGSEVEFYRAQGRHASYLTLYDDVVLTANMEGGYANVFGETESLPLDKRFFLGGTRSLRGFARNSVGPLDEGGTAVGGDVWASYSIEVDFPVAKKIYGALFTDGGNSWLVDPAGGTRNMPFRFSAGVGLRYSTPVGYIRLDYGVKLKRMGDEDAGEVHFLIGGRF